jgi:hypothetical protein
MRCFEAFLKKHSPVSVLLCDPSYSFKKLFRAGLGLAGNYNKGVGTPGIARVDFEGVLGCALGRAVFSAEFLAGVRE